MELNQIFCLIILFVCVFLFVTRLIPEAVTVCLGCLLFNVFGITSIQESFGGFIDNTVLILFSIMVLGIAMCDVGMADFISAVLMKFYRKNERIFLMLILIVAGVLSSFMSNVIVVSVLLPIIAILSQNNKDFNAKDYMMPISMSAGFGGGLLLIGIAVQLAANNLLDKFCGKTLGMFDYLGPGLVMFFIFLLYEFFIGYPLGKKLWGKSVVPIEVEHNETAVNPRKFVIIGCIIVLMFVLFITNFIDSATAAIIIALLCVLTGCTNVKSINKNMNWSIIFLLAGCIGIANGILKSELMNLIADFFNHLIPQNTSPFLIMLVFVILTMFVSNFITNMASAMLFLPIALAICLERQFNPITFTIAIVYAADLCFSTPIGSPQYTASMVAGYKFSDYIKYTWILDILVIAGICLIIPVFYPF